MARTQYCLKTIELSTHFNTTAELFFHGERHMNEWLYRTPAGRWCKKNVTDLTFRVNYQYNNENKYPVIEVVARLEPEDYTLYLLKHGGTDERTNN
jgi:hypothetical protein